MAKLSIVIPALNEEKYLPNLLTALTNQTRTNFEVVVVDGSSRDQTVAVARSFISKLPSLRVVISEMANLPLQKNLGAHATEGEWLVFIDADSVPLPYFVERLERFIEAEAAQFFTTWFRPDSETASDALFTLVANLYVESAIVLKRAIAPGPLTVVRREVFELVGGYTETITFGDDYDFTCKIVDRGIALHILRETLYVLSLRRVRKDGKMRFIWFYFKMALFVLLTKRNLKHVPSYVMGGHVFETDNPI